MRELLRDVRGLVEPDESRHEEGEPREPVARRFGTQRRNRRGTGNEPAAQS